MTHPSDAEIAVEIAHRTDSIGATWRDRLADEITAALARVRRGTWEEAARIVPDVESAAILRSRAEEGK